MNNSAKLAIGNQTYLIESDDNYLGRFHGVFQPDMVVLFQTLAAGSSTVLDIGANIGCTALLFSQLADRVYAFEASPSTYAFLAKNIAQATTGNIQAFNCGIGAEAGALTLTYAPANRAGGFVSNLTQANQSHIVEEITIESIDDFLAANGIGPVDFMKIDVEGFERFVLRGAAKTLAANKPLTVLELDHFCLDILQRTTVPDFLDEVCSIFPIVLAVEGQHYLDINNDNERYATMYHHVVNHRYGNLICAFDESQLQRFRRDYHHGEAPLAPQPPSTWSLGYWRQRLMSLVK